MFRLLTHNDDTQLFYEDDYFAGYFEKLHERAKNAFVFFQGDHGARSGKGFILQVNV